MIVLLYGVTLRLLDNINSILHNTETNHDKTTRATINTNEYTKLIIIITVIDY